jgi:hypothetical protein
MTLIDTYEQPFLFRIDIWVVTIALFTLMMFSMSAGSSIAEKRRAKNDAVENPANATVYSAVFGLLAFLLAFTFSMSGSRFDMRWRASVAEGNAIGTAILRADLYPDTERLALRDDFKKYLQARIVSVTNGSYDEKVVEADVQASIYAARLWKRATDFSKSNQSIIVSSQMLPALNAMFDSASTTNYSERMRVPQSIVVMLFILSIISSFFVGYHSIGKGRFDWVLGIGFCLLTSLVIFITLDLDRPRHGLIKLNASHDAIVSLMKQLEN